jgi:hypothetical protein
LAWYFILTSLAIVGIDLCVLQNDYICDNLLRSSVKWHPHFICPVDHDWRLLLGGMFVCNLYATGNRRPGSIRSVSHHLQPRVQLKRVTQGWRVVYDISCKRRLVGLPRTLLIIYSCSWFGQHVVPSLSDCLLPQQTSWWDQTAAPSTTFLLGPFVCPNGYTTATTSTLNSLSTLIACCPR